MREAGEGGRKGERVEKREGEGQGGREGEREERDRGRQGRRETGTEGGART